MLGGVRQSRHDVQVACAQDIACTTPWCPCKTECMARMCCKDKVGEPQDPRRTRPACAGHMHVMQHASAHRTLYTCEADVRHLQIPVTCRYMKIVQVQVCCEVKLCSTPLMQPPTASTCSFAAGVYVYPFLRAVCGNAYDRVTRRVR